MMTLMLAVNGEMRILGENHMRYPARETAEKHQKFLGHASRLFRERGFSGVSVGEIHEGRGPYARTVLQSFRVQGAADGGMHRASGILVARTPSAGGLPTADQT